MRPRDANTIPKICRLREDNISWGGYSILIDGSNVTIFKKGVAQESMTIPRLVFNRFTDWNNAEQEPTHE